MQLGFIFVLIVSIFIAIFAIQNGNPVPIDLFLARYEVPLAVVIMVCLILGAVIAIILGMFRQIKKNSVSKEMKSKLKTYETEKVEYDKNIENLQNQNQALTESNIGFEKKVTEFQTKIDEQKLAIDKLIEVLKENHIITNSEVEEDASSNLENEKSQVAGM